MVGSVLVATPSSVHSTFIELQLLIVPQHHIHIPPRRLLCRRLGLRLGLGLGLKEVFVFDNAQSCWALIRHEGSSSSIIKCAYNAQSCWALITHEGSSSSIIKCAYNAQSCWALITH